MSDMDTFKDKVQEISYPNLQFKTAYREKCEEIIIEKTILMDGLTVLDGSLDEEKKQVLKGW